MGFHKYFMALFMALAVLAGSVLTQSEAKFVG